MSQRNDEKRMAALELTCPACGALIEASTLDELVERARAHTLDAHAYDIPAEHVIKALKEGGS